MSKKKRRLKKRIKQKNRKRHISLGKDCHHLLFQKRHWQGGLKGSLRLHWYCRVYIPRDTLHKEIHSLVKTVPVPKEESIKFALTHLEYLEKNGAIDDKDNIEKRLKVLIALFECADDQTADALKEQLEIVTSFYKDPP